MSVERALPRLVHVSSLAPQRLEILGFSLGVEAGNQLVLLPLFAVLKIVRRAQSDAVIRPQGATLFLRINSAAISVGRACIIFALR